MIESKERKSAFLRESNPGPLGWSMRPVETERFEIASDKAELRRSADVVTVRAVKADSLLFETAGQMLNEGGRLLLFRPAHSASADPPGFELVNTVLLMDSPPSFLSIYRVPLEHYKSKN